MLNAMNLVGAAAEVGVREGTYSHYLLTHWRGAKLYSIDAWTESPGYFYSGDAPTPQAEHDMVYQKTVAMLAPFGARSVILRQWSLDAAEQFRDGALDFCFIDAAHEYENVKRDLAAWYPKVRRGGILAGHDYTNETEDGIHYGVKRAVDEFCREHGLKLILTRELFKPSWLIFK